MSESAYDVRDRAHTYQYRGFGVPDLALKRGLSKRARHRAVRDAAGDAGRATSGDQESGRARGGRRARAVRVPRCARLHAPSPGSREDDRCDVHGAPRRHEPRGVSTMRSTATLAEPLSHRRSRSVGRADSAGANPRRLVLQDVAQQDEAMRVPSETEKPAVRELDTAAYSAAARRAARQHAVHVLVSNAGSGISRYGDLAINRWRSDGTQDDYGQWCYVRDVTTGRVWSAGHQPVRAKAQLVSGAVRERPRQRFIRRDGDIETLMEIAIVPASRPVFARSPFSTDRRSRARSSSRATWRVVLAKPDADRVHPAFGNLFVQTEWLPGSAALLAMRRPRSAKNKDRGADTSSQSRAGDDAVSRAKLTAREFVGRGRSAQKPCSRWTTRAL